MNMPFFILPLVSLLALFAIIQRHDSNWRRSLLSAAIGLGLLFTAITEFLSLFSQITFGWVLIAWVLCSSGLLLGCWLSGTGCSWIRLQNSSFLSPFLTFSGIGILTVLLTLGVVALTAPPNNWDSMTYHMSRVMNWIQNQNLAHYPTHTPRQLDQPPWSGFAVMHLQLLSDSDRFANMVQWFSLLGSTVGVSLIAKELGASLIGQMLSSVVCVTTPMAILQASTTQTDLNVSFWLVCFTYNFLLITHQKANLRTVSEAGVSLGLALLTKPTAYIYPIPFCLMLAFQLIQQFKWKAWQPISMLFGLALLLNLAQGWRNWTVFNTPLGITGEVTKNHLLTIPALISNFSRHLSLHTATISSTLNHWIEQSIYLLHQIIGLDVNDSRTTFPFTAFRVLATSKEQPIFLHEDISGNPIHLLLIVVCLLLYFRKRSLHRKVLILYILILISAFSCFSLLIAWQPWASRLHLPIFILFSAFIGTILSRYFNNSLIRYLIVISLLFSSVPYLLFNAVKPIAAHPQFITFIPNNIFKSERIDQYFSSRSNLQAPYQEAVRQVQSRSCETIGLYIEGESWEYPLWVLLRQAYQSAELPAPLIQSVNVKNSSGQTFQRSRQMPPCAMIVVAEKDKTKRRRQIQVKNILYGRIWFSNPVGVYIQQS
jgi:hypothetical protein